MTILGLNAYHGDSAACLVRDGALVVAAEEERFRRVKHWAGLPTEAIKFCLREAAVRLGDLDHIAINRQPGMNNWRRLLFVLRHRPDVGLIKNRLLNIRNAASIEDSLREAFPGEDLHASVHHIEHHLAHLASAYLVSPFREAVCVSVDGFGDFASAAWGLGRDHDIRIDGRIYFPHSLGIFYSAITQLLGFPHFGDEYKVMGLAPYGEPKYLDQMRQIVRVQRNGTYELDLRFFRHHTANVSYTWKDCAPEVGTLYTSPLEELLGSKRSHEQPLEQKHRDLARSAQAMYEEAFFALLNVLHARYQCPNLALSGGCAMNSVANGKVYLQTSFKKMYLPAAAGDAGGAIGAALVVGLGGEGGTKMADGRGQMAEGGSWEGECQQQKGLSRTGQSRKQKAEKSVSDWPKRKPEMGRNGRFVMKDAYTGPAFDDGEIGRLLDSKDILNSSFSVLRCNSDEDLCRGGASAIAAGGVVGWFQGRMEWGPRALGNRSILCDPRRADMKEILNAKIKRRESFRPFAPSILREHVAEWFEQEDDVPFMMEVFKFRPEKRPLVPAVCHVDGSGRLQTVHRETNPLYHRLISAFEALTSVPLVLNTSFNENEPVVCRPEEALECFLRTRMDVLVLGSFFIERI